MSTKFSNYMTSSKIATAKFFIFFISPRKDEFYNKSGYLR